MERLAWQEQPGIHTTQLNTNQTRKKNLLQQLPQPQTQTAEGRNGESQQLQRCMVCLRITFPNGPLLNGLSLPQVEEKEDRTALLQVILRLSGFNNTLSLSYSLRGGGRCNGWRQWVERGTLNLWEGCQYMMASAIVCTQMSLRVVVFSFHLRDNNLWDWSSWFFIHT